MASQRQTVGSAHVSLGHRKHDRLPPQRYRERYQRQILQQQLQHYRPQQSQPQPYYNHVNQDKINQQLRLGLQPGQPGQQIHALPRQVSQSMRRIDAIQKITQLITITQVNACLEEKNDIIRLSSLLINLESHYSKHKLAYAPFTLNMKSYGVPYCFVTNGVANAIYDIINTCSYKSAVEVYYDCVKSLVKLNRSKKGFDSGYGKRLLIQCLAGHFPMIVAYNSAVLKDELKYEDEDFMIPVIWAMAQTPADFAPFATTAWVNILLPSLEFKDMNPKIHEFCFKYGELILTSGENNRYDTTVNLVKAIKVIVNMKTNQAIREHTEQTADLFPLLLHMTVFRCGEQTKKDNFVRIMEQINKKERISPILENYYCECLCECLRIDHRFFFNLWFRYVNEQNNVTSYNKSLRSTTILLSSIDNPTVLEMLPIDKVADFCELLVKMDKTKTWESQKDDGPAMLGINNKIKKIKTFKKKLRPDPMIISKKKPSLRNKTKKKKRHWLRDFMLKLFLFLVFVFVLILFINTQCKVTPCRTKEPCHPLHPCSIVQHPTIFKYLTKIDGQYIKPLYAHLRTTFGPTLEPILPLLRSLVFHFQQMMVRFTTELTQTAIYQRIEPIIYQAFFFFSNNFTVYFHPVVESLSHLLMSFNDVLFEPVIIPVLGYLFRLMILILIVSQHVGLKLYGFLLVYVWPLMLMIIEYFKEKVLTSLCDLYLYVYDDIVLQRLSEMFLPYKNFTANVSLPS